MNRTKSRVELEARTMAFGLNTLKVLRELPAGVEFKGIRRQLTHAATSIGSFYREANRAESRMDYLNRIVAAQKEVVAAEYWLGLIKGLHSDIPGVDAAYDEAAELLELFDQIRRAAEKSHAAAERSLRAHGHAGRSGKFSHPDIRQCHPAVHAND